MSFNQMVSENTFTPAAQHSSLVNVLMVIMDRWQADITNRTIMAVEMQTDRQESGAHVCDSNRKVDKQN